MERERIINTINQMKKPVDRLYFVRKHYRKLNSPCFDLCALPKWVKFILGFSIYLIICVLIQETLKHFYLGVGLNRLLLTTTFCIAVLFVGIYLLSAIEIYSNLLQIKHRSTKNRDKIEKLEKEESIIMEFLSHCPIPPDYWFPDALYSVQKNISTSRANTLRAAINLFEIDMQFKNKNRENQSIKQIKLETISADRKKIKFINIFNPGM